MKVQYLSSKFVILIFCSAIIFTVGYCQTASTKQFDYDLIISDKNSKINQENENTAFENDEDECLTAEYPKHKTIVSVGVANSRAIDIPKPKYPEEAKAKKIGGKVGAEVFVDEKGKIVWARVENGNELLQDAVKEVVCRATFKPVTLSGKPISIKGIITYNFVLPE